MRDSGGRLGLLRGALGTGASPRAVGGFRRSPV